MLHLLSQSNLNAEVVISTDILLLVSTALYIRKYY